MFYVLQSSTRDNVGAIALRSVNAVDDVDAPRRSSVDAAADIDFVDDAILNVSPHNPIERQLLTGDMVGLALMSSAILWTAMGAIA